ncbi:MAG: DegT/DnrJ/EryC1/StrS family aminotransferase [Desulfuromonadaceae bacterium]|nr:DegT/DnrJ/EryC1/StrS family aminotransferase [Desulfuromonadaceae bacterium]
MLKVPFVNLSLQHKALKRPLLKSIAEMLDSGQFILGPVVEEFEKTFAAFCDTQFAVGVDNGTNALLLTLKALGIGPGDEVITAANSFLASASCIALAGATPVFADVRDDYAIDPYFVESVITSRTKAIIPVHLTGHPAEMDTIIQLADKHCIYVVEDAAQAVGAKFAGQAVGSFGVAGCFSFHPLKILNAVGDGGMITTSDFALYEMLLKARNHGLKSRDECEFWSFNARLDAIQAIILREKMEYLNQWISKRRDIAKIYSSELAEFVKVPRESERETSVYQTYVIQAERRNQLQQYLAVRGIDTKIHYSIPIHLQEAASSLGYKIGDFRVAEYQSNHILSLPIYPELSTEQLDYVVKTIKKFYMGTGAH